MHHHGLTVDCCLFASTCISVAYCLAKTFTHRESPQTRLAASRVEQGSESRRVSSDALARVEFAGETTGQGATDVQTRRTTCYRYHANNFTIQSTIPSAVKAGQYTTCSGIIPSTTTSCTQISIDSIV